MVIYLYECGDRERAVVHDSGADGGREKGTVGSWWAPAVANLVIGMVAIVPGVCVRWLLTRWALIHCAAGGFGCAKESPDNVVGMMLGALLGGGFVLGMVLVVDVLMPWQEGRPLHLWLGMTTLVPAPFAIAQAAGWI